jgi:pimeloyl-ACP methyl ester carboxylesterase
MERNIPDGVYISQMSIAMRIILIALTLAFSFRAAADGFARATASPYYQVHCEGSTNEGELTISANYTLWVPPGVKTLRGVIVHQHGCGPGDDRSERVMAGDVHWQALARKHDCALLVPTYELSDSNHCRAWHDPRNGSDKKFFQALGELATLSQHPELATVPWALWGHSGGACWAGSMFLSHPERVAAVWLRSNVPLQRAEPIPAAALSVPVMCNLGTREGVTVTNGMFAVAWRFVREFFLEFRGQGGLVGVAVDPNSEHDCGNSRYLAIPWFDACLAARLPDEAGGAQLKPMPTAAAWLAPLLGRKAQPTKKFASDVKTSVWLPNERIAKAWSEFTVDGNVNDSTPPPAPRNVRVNSTGELAWDADADLESGIAEFLIERDGKKLARVPEQHTGYFVGRPSFQQIGYGDEPTSPLAEMRYTDSAVKPNAKHVYTVRTINTAGLKSEPAPSEGALDSSRNPRRETFPYEIICRQWPQGPAITRARAAIRLATNVLDACVGHYGIAPGAVFPTGQKLTISREGDQLRAQFSVDNKTTPPLTLSCASETNLFFKVDVFGELFLVKNEKGEVTAVIRRSSVGGIPDCLAKKL